MKLWNMKYEKWNMKYELWNTYKKEKLEKERNKFNVNYFPDILKWDVNLNVKALSPNKHVCESF
jgi:hypothetical protein